MSEQTNGQCRCGQVKFRVTGRPMITMACHCTGCQRMSSSAFSLSSLYPGQRFEVVEGEPVIGGLHGEPRHFFCPWCMSWLFTRLDLGGELVNVRATLLDNAPRYRVFAETYTSEALPWATTGAAHSFERFPPQERFGPLMQEFAAWDRQ